MPRFNKLLIVGGAEAAMAIRSKAFIVGMMLVPVFSGAAIGFQRISQNQLDREDRRFAILDETGVLYPGIVRLATEWNSGIAPGGPASTSGPRMLPELVSVQGEGADDRRRNLVDRVHRKELKAFVEIPAGVATGDPAAHVRYYSDDGTDAALPRWVENNVNRAVLNERFRASRLDPVEVARLTRQVPLTRLDLPSWDEHGVATTETALDPARTLAVPLVTMMLMMFVVMSSAPTLLHSVMEEKLSRTNEVMLGSVSPFEFMGGKLLGAATVSLIVCAVYLTAAFLVARRFGYVDVVTPRLFIWFAVYSLLAVFLFGSIFIAIGAACSDPKDAQSMMMPSMLLIMMPIFTWPLVLRAPTSALSVTLSLVPTATPFLMLPLTTIQPGPAVWRQALGVCLTAATTVLFVWAAGRIFRVGLLMQGKSATFADMVRWVRAA
jgi:ABC-2 type transport system permease protein